MCVILFLCSCLLLLRLPRLGKRELILVLFVRLFGLCLFRFVGFLFLLGLGRAGVCDCGTLWTFLLPFFQLNTPCGLGEDVQNRFSRCRLWRLSWIFDRTILAYFYPEVVLFLQSKFRL